jgi:amylosucrase
MIQQAGYSPPSHKKFLQEYYSGNYYGSSASGALFSVNPKTQDARISGSLASLCGLEKAIQQNDRIEIDLAIRRILLMQAHSFFIGGIPMIFYGDEMGYTNDYSYLQDPVNSYDNRWMHRPIISWEKNERINVEGSEEQIVFTSTKKLIKIRKNLALVSDLKNLSWMSTHNFNVVGYVRTLEEERLFCLFNFSSKETHLSWIVFKGHGTSPVYLYDHWSETYITVGQDQEWLAMKAYDFLLLKPVEEPKM